MATRNSSMVSCIRSNSSAVDARSSRNSKRRLRSSFAGSLKSSAKARSPQNLPASSVELGLEAVEDVLGGVRDARAVVVPDCSLAARVKGGLTASMLNGTAHRGFDEITEGLSFGDHGVELSAQPRCNTDLRDDSGFHRRSVVHLFYTRDPGFKRGCRVQEVHQAKPNRYESSAVFARRDIDTAMTAGIEIDFAAIRPRKRGDD